MVKNFEGKTEMIGLYHRCTYSIFLQVLLQNTVDKPHIKLPVLTIVLPDYFLK